MGNSKEYERKRHLKRKADPVYQAKRKEYYKKTNSKRVEGNWKRNLLKRYGITVGQYNQMFADQDGNCAICNKNQSELKWRLSVDHCHATGKVRGLLCYNCNLVLGNSFDNIIVLENSIKYLNTSK